MADTIKRNAPIKTILSERSVAQVKALKRLCYVGRSKGTIKRMLAKKVKKKELNY